ncbi:MAG: hypothetical protein ACT4OY_07745 [Alphaproteobacteria bacterium]
MSDKEVLSKKLAAGQRRVLKRSPPHGTRAIIPAMLAPKSERGNALWFILIVIVLLGGLTMLLTRSGSDVDQSGDVERLRIVSSQILRYGKSLQSAIEEMKNRGVSENDISFSNTVTVADYTNTNCTVTDCRVFHIGGGGQTYIAPPANANDGSEWIFNGQNNIGTAAGPVGTTVARSGNDLVLLLANVNEALCKHINKELGVGTTGALPTESGTTETDPFTGAYDNVLNIIAGNPTPFELNRREAGCYDESGTLYFYYVLLAR